MKKLEELGISPAPWEVCKERSLSGEIIGVESCGDSDLVAGDAIIKGPNARIIAAAPELYDAAERFIRFHEESCIHGNRSAGEILADWRKAYDDLKAALAKAGGEEVEDER